MTDNKPVKKEESYDISHLEQTELKLEKTKGISFYYKIKMQAIKGKTELNLLKSQAEAVELESKTFMKAKSAEIAENIKNYLKLSIRDLIQKDTSHKNDSIINIYQECDKKIKEIESLDLEENLKKDLLQKILGNLHDAVTEIQRDGRYKTYNL